MQRIQSTTSESYLIEQDLILAWLFSTFNNKAAWKVQLTYGCASFVFLYHSNFSSKIDYLNRIRIIRLY